MNKVSITVEDNWGNGGGNFTRTIPFDKLTQLMTAAQVEEAKAGGRLLETADKTGFHLLASSTDDAAGAGPAAAASPASTEKAKQEAQPFDTLREQLRAGVQVVAAPQLFKTPAAEASNAVKEVLDLLRPGARVLEPSVGTGRLLEALAAVRRGLDVVAVEINQSLAQALRGSGLAGEVVCADFLACSPEQLGGLFDVLIMNPPFADGADIRHILHALGFLKPGGRLVAICANGPRQRAQLMPLVERTGGHWVDLPEGTFGDEGTNVRTARITIQAG